MRDITSQRVTYSIT